MEIIHLLTGFFTDLAALFKAMTDASNNLENAIKSIIALSLTCLVIFNPNFSPKSFTLKIGPYEIAIGFFDKSIEKIEEALKFANLNIQNNLSSNNVSFSSLLEALRKLANSKNIVVIDSGDASVLVQNLADRGVISKDYLEPIKALQILERKEIRDTNSIAGRKYKRIIAELIDSINALIPLSPPQPPKPDNLPRKTQVGGFVGFAPPETGRPSTVLHCLSGVLQGKRFAIEKPIYWIGAKSENDLVIANDNYVSGQHAYISYNQGGLTLVDNNSSNGTVLNGGKPFKGTSVALKSGDKITLGKCTFELV